MSLVDREIEKQELVGDIIGQDKKNGISVFSKIKTTLLLSFIILIIAWIWFSIYDWFRTTIIDNPYGTGITIQIDENDEFDLAPYTSKILKIWKWNHKLYVDWNFAWDFTKKEFFTSSFLNPTDDIYIQEYILYWEEQYTSKLPNNKIEAYWNEAEWPFKTYKWIYFEWDWNYSIDEIFPDEIKIEDDYKIKSKLYRFDDFVDMFNTDYVVEE